MVNTGDGGDVGGGVSGGGGGTVISVKFAVKTLQILTRADDNHWTYMNCQSSWF